MISLLVFSHLRWNFVYQRPQHLMTRLARHYRVIFIEEPMLCDGESHLCTHEGADNVLVVQPFTPVAAGGFHDAQLAEMRPLLEDLIEGLQIEEYAAWLFTPMALPLLAGLHPQAIVYDCMDELSAFRNAPRQLIQRENALLRMADLVFTGGRSLYQAKVDRHPSVHCFPSSVDREHFGQGRYTNIEHPLLQNIAHPRLGYCGVIDERLDLQLIAQLAAARPDYQIIMVGPLAKITEQDTPQAANIHYLGQQAYADLPRFFAGWDVGLMPFALNEATRYISPTKTLEYMAAELPIVSTPINDVVEPYSDSVYIGYDTETFIQHCEDALLNDQNERTQKMRAVLDATSWEKTASQMHLLIEKACKQGPRLASQDVFAAQHSDEHDLICKMPAPSRLVAARP